MCLEEMFSFRSDAALNLHHVLYAEARGQEAVASGRTAGGRALRGDLGLRVASGYQRAVDYYRQHLISRDVWFDESIRLLSALLVGDDGSAPAGWDGVFDPLLDHYLDLDWPVHRVRNLAWTDRLVIGLSKLMPEVMARLEEVFRQRLPDPPILVSTIFVAHRLPAYTSLRPTRVSCSTNHPRSQGLAAVEILLHEASHALAGPLRTALSDRIDPEHPGSRQLWHVVLFYLVGEVVAAAWARRGVDYRPYLEATGLFDRAWPTVRTPVTDACSGYLDGTWDWDSTWDRLAESVQARG